MSDQTNLPHEQDPPYEQQQDRWALAHIAAIIALSCLALAAPIT